MDREVLKSRIEYALEHIHDLIYAIESRSI